MSITIPFNIVDHARKRLVKKYNNLADTQLSQDLNDYFDKFYPNAHINTTSYIGDRNWVLEDTDYWSLVPFYSQRVGKTQVYISKKNNTNSTHEDILKVLRSDAAFFSWGEQRTQAQALLARYQHYLQENKQWFLEQLRQSLAETLIKELEKVRSATHYERFVKLQEELTLELRYLASLEHQTDLINTEACLEMHHRLNLLQKKVQTFCEDILVNPESIHRIKRQTELFSVINKEYIDNTLVLLSPSSSKKIVDIFIFIMATIAVIGIIASLTTGIGALAYLSLFGALIMAREVYYLSRGLWYGRAPTRSMLYTIGLGIAFFAIGIVAPAFMDFMGLIIDGLALAKDVLQVTLTGVSNLVPFIKNNIIAKTSAFVVGFIASLWGIKYVLQKVNRLSSPSSSRRSSLSDSNANLTESLDSRSVSFTSTQGKKPIIHAAPTESKLPEPTGELLTVHKHDKLEKIPTYLPEISTTQVEYLFLREAQSTPSNGPMSNQAKKISKEDFRTLLNDINSDLKSYKHLFELVCKDKKIEPYEKVLLANALKTLQEKTTLALKTPNITQNIRIKEQLEPLVTMINASLKQIDAMEEDKVYFLEKTKLGIKRGWDF